MESYFNETYAHLGPVVLNIASLTNTLRGQRVECFYNFITKYTDIFVEFMREDFALQKLLTLF